MLFLVLRVLYISPKISCSQSYFISEQLKIILKLDHKYCPHHQATNPHKAAMYNYRIRILIIVPNQASMYSVFFVAQFWRSIPKTIVTVILYPSAEEWTEPCIERNSKYHHQNIQNSRNKNITVGFESNFAIHYVWNRISDNSTYEIALHISFIFNTQKGQNCIIGNRHLI